MAFNIIWKFISLLIIGVSLVNSKLSSHTRRIDTTESLHRDGFHFLGTSDIDSEHEITFAVKQNNLDFLERLLSKISDPTSPHYARYLSPSKIANLTSNQNGSQALTDFLSRNDITILNQSVSGHYITARAKIQKWESILTTKFHQFRRINETFGPIFHRAINFTIPTELFGHLDSMLNVHTFPSAMSTSSFRILQLATVDNTIYPSKLSNYYNVSTNLGSRLGSQGVFGSIGQYISPNDLTLFQHHFNLPNDPLAGDSGSHVDDVPCRDQAQNCIEANLDVQYIKAISPVIPTTFAYDNSDNPFLNWIISLSNSSNPPLVNVVSYGTTEASFPAEAARLFNTEAIKLALRGVSIIVASGDDGVSSTARKDASACSYVPVFPATSPFVTTVGATQGPESDQPEKACQSNTDGIITTGGGFSNLFSAPPFQKAILANYFGSIPTPMTPMQGFAQTGRGYPDLSITGHNYQVVINGLIYKVSGTSASAPVFAGMIALINAERLAAGKRPLGYLNPAIYAFHRMFTNDVIDGRNNCCATEPGGTPICCSEGFSAGPGWDPVTGFGSVNFQKLRETFLKFK